jgi:hypothetical protein
VIQPAENFFMQANTVIVSALYNIDMLVADVGNAVSSPIEGICSVLTFISRLKRTSLMR